jgi:outer membrane protein OmpA-like peptidoglycan-associated protein
LAQGENRLRRIGFAAGRGLWILLAVGAAGTAPRPGVSVGGGEAFGARGPDRVTVVQAGLPLRFLPWDRITQPYREGWPYAEYPPVPWGHRLTGLLRTFTFQRNSAAIDAEARGTLASAAEAWREKPWTFLLVVGHADGFAERSRARALALARAEAAERYLASRGVPRSRMKALSLGAEYASSSETQFVILSPDRKVEIWGFD